MPDVTETVQWYRGSTLIPGATELDYATTAADVGQTLKARFTGTRSGWAAGTVDSVGVGITPGAAPQLISSLVVDGSGQVGSTLSVDTVSWDMPDVVTTYQWKRNGSAVRGQTGPSYVVAPADRDQALVVVVTGTRPGYDAAVVESAPVRPAVGEAPVAVTPPGVTGTPEPGQTLSATTGAWSVGELAFSYQWLRGGEAISSGGTRSTYTVTPADAGRAVSVRVTARRAGYADGTATSPALAVARLRSTATGTPSATRTRKGRAMTVSARITASGLMPTGTVTLFADGRKVTTGRLDSRGGTTFRYTPRSTGKDKLVVKYGGSTQVLPSASRAVTITVTR